MPETTSETSVLDANRPEVSTGPTALLLVGNPNVGKSVIFGALTGRYVTVSNYPGTTIEVARGPAVLRGQEYSVLDTPGTNQLTPLSEDERVTRELLLERDGGIIVQVADSKNLRRALMLTLELGEMDLPLTLVLNMADEARLRNIKVDHERLERLLGVPVVEMVATRKEGLERLEEAAVRSRPASEALRASYPLPVEEQILKVSDQIPLINPPARFLALQLLGGDLSIWSFLRSRMDEDQTARLQAALGSAMAALGPNTAEQIRAARQEAVERIVEQVYRAGDTGSRLDFGSRLSAWVLHPVKGLGVLALILYLTYWFVGLIGAGTLSDLMDKGLFRQFLRPEATVLLDHVLPFPHTHPAVAVAVGVALPLGPSRAIPLGQAWERNVPAVTYEMTPGTVLSRKQQAFRLIHDFLIGPYGAITMGLSYGLAIVLPIVTTFFFLFSILEDSGYLPRLAVMVNRLFRTMGLNGKAVLPMVLGLGCDTMATLTTRILETKKQRLIVTLLLALGVPCSAQLGVLLGMMSHVTPLGALVWGAVVTLVMLTVGFLAARLFPGENTDFLIELPPMRQPVVSNIVLKTLARVQWYLREVLPLFLLGTALLFVLDRTHALVGLRHICAPVVVHWLGLPAEMADAFILGFLRRDYGAVFLLQAASGPNPLLNGTQVLVSMIVITLFVPCIANLFIIVREHGMKMAAGMALFIFPFAFLVGGVVRLIASGLGLHF
jgi:ferrous iron transport protein B